jgi:hypothetical protein
MDSETEARMLAIKAIEDAKAANAIRKTFGVPFCCRRVKAADDAEAAKAIEKTFIVLNKGL